MRIRWTWIQRRGSLGESIEESVMSERINVGNTAAAFGGAIQAGTNAAVASIRYDRAIVSQLQSLATIDAVLLRRGPLACRRGRHPDHPRPVVIATLEREKGGTSDGAALSRSRHPRSRQAYRSVGVSSGPGAITSRRGRTHPSVSMPRAAINSRCIASASTRCSRRSAWHRLGCTCAREGSVSPLSIAVV